jgi:iron complex transport system substrate-binding protein
MTDPSALRIVSLLPSATEIVDILGCTDALVGRSHECDYPAQVQMLPICTEPRFNPEGTSLEIHDRVTAVLQTALSVYRVKTDVLQALQPTHIVTQAQCDVCAVSVGDVEKAVANLTGCQPQIISLQPSVLAEVWTDLERVAGAFGVSATIAIVALKHRITACQERVQPIPETQRPTVACIEWIDPLMAAGNWIPELVEMAGGKPLFGAIGQHSPWVQWSAFVQADPDIIVVMPCGFNLERTAQEATLLQAHPEWAALRAVQSGRVYLTDGNAYFNRPGPRLVDSLEILAEIFHPAQCPFGYEGTGWQQFR